MDQQQDSVDNKIDWKNVNISDLFPPEWPIRPTTVDEALAWGKPNLAVAICYWDDLIDRSDLFLSETKVKDKYNVISAYIKTWQRIRRESLKTVVSSYTDKADICARCPYTDPDFHPMRHDGCEDPKLAQSSTNAFYQECRLMHASQYEFDKITAYLLARQSIYLKLAEDINFKINALLSLKSDSVQNTPLCAFCRGKQYFQRDHLIVWLSTPQKKFIHGKVLEVKSRYVGFAEILYATIQLKGHVSMKDKKTGENSKTDILFVKVTDPRLMQTVFYLNLLEYKTSAIQYANMSEYCESFSKNVYLEVIEKDTLIKEDIKQKYRIQSKARRDDIKSFNEL